MRTAPATLCVRDKEKPFILLVAIVVGLVVQLPVLLSFKGRLWKSRLVSQVTAE